MENKTKPYRQVQNESRKAGVPKVEKARIICKCPVCEGTGLVSRPPWIAGDVVEWAMATTTTYPCKACDGSGIIVRENE